MNIKGRHSVRFPPPLNRNNREAKRSLLHTSFDSISTQTTASPEQPQAGSQDCFYLEARFQDSKPNLSGVRGGSTVNTHGRHHSEGWWGAGGGGGGVTGLCLQRGRAATLLQVFLGILVWTEHRGKILLRRTKYQYKCPATSHLILSRPEQRRGGRGAPRDWT